MTDKRDVRDIAADRVAAMLMVAGSAGILGRLGLGAIWGAQPRRGGYHPGYMGYDVPSLPDEKKKKKKDDEKEAAIKQANPVSWAHGHLSDLVKHVFKGEGLLGGGTARSVGEVPWLYGAGIPLSLLTIGGSYKLTDKLLENLRKREQKSETDAAKQQYEKLLQQAMDVKSSSVLDDLADYRIKHAWSDWVPFKGEGRKALGIYLALAGLLTAATAKQVYSSKSKRRNRDIIEDAQRLRTLRDTHGPGVPLVFSAPTDDKDYEINS